MKQINIFQVVKNRSIVKFGSCELFLYPNCVDSIIKSTTGSEFSYKLYVCDFMSDDYPLKDWLPQKLGGKIDFEIISIDEPYFDKGLALNISRDVFSGDDFILFLDADNIVSRSAMERVERRFKENKLGSVGFISPFFMDEDGKGGKRFIESVGSLWIRHGDLIRLPKWINMDCWGGEDTVFLYNCIKHGMNVIRETDLDVMHQWHPAHLRNAHYKGGVPPSPKYSDAIRNFYQTGVFIDVS
jgi:hypothetical protein